VSDIDTCGAVWRSSPGGDLHDADNSGAVEVATNLLETTGYVFVRDNRAPGSVLAFTRREWNAFVAGVRDGEFVLPSSAGPRG
jgi:hypothetical protein